MTDLSPSEQEQLSNQGPTINPWEGPAPVGRFQGFFHDDDYSYAAPLARVLEVPGHAVAAGEGMLAGLAHDSYGLVDHVLGGIPGVHKYITKPILDEVDWWRNDAKERTQALTPNPLQVGSAIQGAHQLLTALTEAGFGAAAAGPALAAITVGGSQGYERRQQLEAGGMAPVPAGLVGLESAAANAAGVLTPGLGGFGTSLMARLLTGSAANVGFGLANRYADHLTLEAAGYPDMARQQKVWDGSSMLFDAILGAGFGGLGHLHQQAAMKDLTARLARLREVPGMEDEVMAAQLGLRAQGLAPGIAADPAAAAAHSAALQKATEDLLNGEPVDVSGTGVDTANFVPFYHGSPHEFVGFDSSKIGTGEGSQARGHGIYVGEARETGEYYRKTTVSDQRAAIVYDGKSYFNGEEHGFGGLQTNGVGWEALNMIQQMGGDRAKAVEAFTQLADREVKIAPERGLEGYYRAAAEFAATVDPSKLKPMGGHLYSGRIPREAYERMIDWDRPMRDQPQSVKDALLEHVKVYGRPVGDFTDVRISMPGVPDAGVGMFHSSEAQHLIDDPAAALDRLPLKGEYLHNWLAKAKGGPKEAADFLRSIGVPGIRYLDAGSRVAGEGTRNMVLFDPSIAQITGREGPRPYQAPEQPISLAGLDPRETILIKSFQDAGLLDAQRDVEELERALNVRLGRETTPVETPVLTGEKPPAAAEAAPAEDVSKAESAPAPAPKTPSPGFKIHPDDIPRAKPGKLNDTQRTIETRFAEQLARDPDLARRQYAQLEDADGGRILNTDTARELSEDYLADRSQSAAVHEPASWLIKRMYAQMLKEPPGPGRDPLVIIMAGGTGAGKSTVVQRLSGELFKRAQIIYDTNFSKLDGAIEKTNDALGAGKRVVRYYVFRDPAEALAHGALTRAMKQEAKWGTGRTVPIEEHTNTHVGAMHVLAPYADHFDGHEDVALKYIDNSRGAGNQVLVSIEDIPRLEYNSTREQVAKTLEAEWDAGHLSESVYRGFGGTRPARDTGGAGAAGAAGAAGPGGAGEHAQEPGAGPAHELTSGPVATYGTTWYRAESGKKLNQGVVSLALNKPQAQKYAAGLKGVGKRKGTPVNSYQVDPGRVLDFRGDPEAQKFVVDALKKTGEYDWLTADEARVKAGYHIFAENPAVLKAAKAAGYDSIVSSEYPDGREPTLSLFDAKRMQRQVPAMAAAPPGESLKDMLRRVNDTSARMSVIEHEGRLFLSSLTVHEADRSTGQGSAAMRELTAYADRVGKAIDLTVGGHLGGDPKRLHPFYERFGFKDESHGSRDMMREPVAPAGAAGVNTASVQRVYTAAGRQVDVRPKLIEAADLTTSDKEGYPQGLQPRQRGERTALASQVQDMARNLKPEMLGQSAEADRGAPIVGADNVVESGNGRVMALRQVYDSLPDQALAYRKFLTDSGYDIAGMKEPVLVRERITPMSPAERTAFTGEANVGTTATYSPVEQAQADAKLLDSGSLAKMAGSDLTTYTNAAFLRDFVSGLAPSERSGVMNPDGTISQAGVKRVSNAILAKAYGGTAESNATLGRFMESTDTGLKSTLNALVDAAPAYARLKQMIEDGVIGKEYDIAPAIVQAVEDVARLQATGQSLKEHFAQSDIFSPRALATQAFYDKAGERLVGREKAAAALVRYADQAMAQRLNQGNLFGDPPASAVELLQSAKKPQTGDLFGLRTKTGELEPGSIVVSTARSAIAEKPNMELPDENGQVVRAQAALLASAEHEQTTAERAPPAIEAATDCFLRKGP